MVDGAGLTADQFLSFLTQAAFFLVFLLTGWSALRRPRRAAINTALFFGVIAAVVLWQWLSGVLHLAPNRIASTIVGALFFTLPYLMLRLVDDFAYVPRWIKRAAEAGLALSAGALVALNSWETADPRRVAPTVVLIVYFVVLIAYSGVRFVMEAAQTTGVTQRRMQAVAVGSILLALLLFLALPQLFVPSLAPVLSIVNRLCGLASGLAFFLGFAPPPILRRAWQEPELRAFLGRAASLPRLATTDEIVAEIERGAAAALGTPHASVGLWDRERDVLRYRAPGGDILEAPSDRYVPGRAFTTQRPIYCDDAMRDDPENAEEYRRNGARAVLSAPITAGAEQLGVLTAYSPRPPIFADDDLVLLRLLADQAAVILESRRLIDDAARVRAQEEATRLRDDFLSSAAHDLKTPLTTLLAQAQLLERKAARDPEAPADLSGIRRLVGETRRLNGLVLELLDASRAEHGRILASLEPLDLAEVAHVVCGRVTTERHPCRAETAGTVEGQFDRTRIEQVLNNLLENAIKYSPEGGAIVVRVWAEGERAHLTVADKGIGILPEDQPFVFERFHRGRNVDDRQFAGMGLGLYICRAIVEAHGGVIRVSSESGAGTTFHVELPLEPPVTVRQHEPLAAASV
ncbi:MAG TPA: ATP-binding protein [Chloroflexota bacterium]|nr:ATP-binding protein [Chloroflexota bacterium]